MSDADWIWVLGYAVMLAVTSAASTVCLILDKRRAERGGWRIPEQTLHLLELLGGWPASWLTRRAIRHKTVKLRYRVTFALVTTVHLAAVGALAWLRWGR